MPNQIDAAWLEPTWFIDSDAPIVQDFAERAANGATDPIEVAGNLFYAVRDSLRYDPYQTEYAPQAFRASTVAQTNANWCIPKSVLYAAAARAKGIPARLGFADVRNHLTSEKLRASMGSDIFHWHGYAELLLGGTWVKLSTAFNIELCERFGVGVLEFDPVNGALMHPFDQHGNKHMEYVRERGSFNDLPFDAIMDTFAQAYANGPGAQEPAPADTHDPAFHD